jgi:hypothetical protein
VTFNPHPKTLTMAGDYEYFAAQGHHPFAFALAELIDNALRATKVCEGRALSVTPRAGAPPAWKARPTALRVDTAGEWRAPQEHQRQPAAV